MSRSSARSRGYNFFNDNLFPDAPAEGHLGATNKADQRAIVSEFVDFGEFAHPELTQAAAEGGLRWQIADAQPGTDFGLAKV